MRQLLHLARAERGAVGEDGELIAAEGPRGEHIDEDERCCSGHLPIVPRGRAPANQKMRGRGDSETGTGFAGAKLSEILPAARVARFVRMTKKMAALRANPLLRARERAIAEESQRALERDRK